MDLSTKYLGLTLSHPFMVGASPLADHLDTVKRLEDGGAAAIVLRSLFEEQISLAESGRIHQMDPYEQQFAAALAGFPRPERYPLSPDDYLDHVRRVKQTVRVPVVASLNGMTAEAWLRFAHSIEQAGADALELNIYEVLTDPAQSALAFETEIRNVVAEVKRTIAIPVAVKLGPYFTAFAHLARRLDHAGADGLILFNRFYQPDIDMNTMTAVPRITLSSSAELLLRLRWAVVLRSVVRCSLAVTGGIGDPADGIKALLAGADVVQIVSAILRHGPAYFLAMRDGLVRWMEAKQLASLDDVRGRIDGHAIAGGLLERAGYIQTLQSWSEPTSPPA